MNGDFSLEQLHNPWGLRPESLSVIARAVKGEMSAEGLRAAAEAAAAGPTAAVNSTGGVAVIALRGLITPQPSILSLLFGGGGGLARFRQSFRDAVNADDISAILLNVDSPGGSTDLIAETAAELRAARGAKPIVAIANTCAASAAYWLASQADEIVVTPSGEVGSIGVFCVHEEYSQMDEKLGIGTTLVSAGKYKTEGNPYEPLSDEARTAIQSTVDDFYELFVADVAKGRGVRASAVKGGYGEGRMVTARRAVELGMADRVDTFEDTVARLAGGRSRRTRKAAAGAQGAGAESTVHGNPQPNPDDTSGEEAAARTARAIEALLPAL